MKPCIPIFAYFCAFSAIIFLAGGGGIPTDRSGRYAPDPLNAAYLIEGRAVGLMDGRCQLPAAPGASMKTRTAVWGQPVYGDLDGDDDDDAVLLLTHDPGGSGTFFYVVAAINAKERYLGTNAVLLGDRIVPKDIGIRHGAIVIDYADRRPEEPMSANPSVDQTAVLDLKNDQLFAVASLGEKTILVEGWVTIGHEVRSFEPCGRKEVLWLMGQSPAIQGIMAAYRQLLPVEKAGQPLFMVLAGEWVAPPVDGFGADYEAAFLAIHLVRAAPGENRTGIDQRFFK